MICLISQIGLILYQQISKKGSTKTTANSMNILFEKNEAHVTLKIPTRMDKLIKRANEKLRVTRSNYIRVAIKEKLEKDLEADLSK